MSDTPEIPEELHVLAGEYVLGALDAGEMRAVRRQAMVNPTLAAAITGWEQRLAPMTQAIPAMPPPEALWSRIEEAIAPMPEEAAEAMPRLAPPPLRPLAVPDDAPVSFARRAALQRMRPRTVWPWQLATVASLGLAAGVAALVLMPSLATQLHLPMLGDRFAPEVAVLMPPDTRAHDSRQDGTLPQMAADSSTTGSLADVRQDGSATSAPPESRVPGFLAEARPDGTVLLTALARGETPAGKAFELWILPPGAAAARSLGVLPAAGRTVALPAMPPAGTALLVSLEPPGGSPTGAPTGPVVYSGRLGQTRL